ncbi:hypothetical protein A7A08_02164 [Methyloligella halotolerans]|uniref:Uncharacterized protein n=1 Tax=Methyloligella halotolerans TaxID=1177755 RepID=A0A1E2RX97_9HYPH|nr:DUF5330 domain-containing protein [Methyloligella halotolerans]ODA66867.1 hypothetical protein A7A08_02164 [Methyloligella halotolerans]
MFLIRMAFWIIVVILLLPTDRAQQTDVLGTAQAAVKDISGFCTRNPDVCVKGGDYFEIFIAKAEFGVSMVMNFVNERTGDDVEVPAVYEASGEPTLLVAPQPQNVMAPAQREEVSSGKSENTLKPTDLSPSWHGPQGT